MIFIIGLAMWIVGLFLVMWTIRKVRREDNLRKALILVGIIPVSGFIAMAYSVVTFLLATLS